MELHGQSTSQFKKLPTFLKWLKSEPFNVEGKLKVVTMVWFPSEYPNITIDTECFRLRIPITGDNAEEVQEWFSLSFQQDEVLAVRIDDKKLGKFSVINIPGERGAWEPVGETGYRCTVQEKRIKRKT